MEQATERTHRLTGGALRTTAAAAVLLGMVVVAGDRSFAPLMMDPPDDRTPADVLATRAVYWHVASYGTRPARSQDLLTTGGREPDE